MNPQPTLGGALWYGNTQLTTRPQLLSTSSGIAGNISTLQQQVSTLTVSSGVTLWANFPAITNVNMAGFNLFNTRQVSTLSLNVSSINGTDININASTVGIGLVEITGSTITTGVGGTQITGGAVTTNEVKSKSYTVSDVVDAVGAAVDTVTDAGQAVSGVFGSVQTAAQVATVAYGVGTIANGVNAANGVVDLATKTASLFTTRIANTISGPAGPPGQTTPVYETINGTTQFQFSTLNTESFTVFRTIDKTNPNQTFGNEVFISTIIAPGTKCVRSVSDPLQFVIISSILISTNNFLQSYGQWFPVLAPEFNLNISTLTADNIFTSFLSSPRTIVSSINDSITVFNSNLCNVGQFQANNGIFSNAIIITNNAQVGSLTSLGAISGTSGSFSGNVGANNLTATSAVNGATAVFSGSVSGGSFFTLNNALVGSLTVTTSAGVGSLSVTGTAAAATVNATTFNGTGIATFATINGTTMNASTLNAIQISTGSILLSSVNGFDINSILTPAVGIPDNLSTLTISTGSAVISSINGFSFASLLNPAAVTFSTASTFLQLFTSSLQASNINTNSLQANQLLTSSLLASNINTNALQANQLFTSSLVASNINNNSLQTNQLLTSSLVASNINTNFLQTTQLLTSSLQALTISTTNANISTINLIGQINISTNLVFSDSPVFDISKTISLTSTSFSTISSFQNNILRYTYNATVGDETAFDIGPGYNLGSDNVAQWASTILLGTNENAVMTIEIDNDPSTGFLGTGTFDAQRQQLDPSNPPYNILVQFSLGGATIVDIPFNDFRIYRFTKSTAGTPVNWTYVIGPPTYQTVNNNVFQITQNLTDVTLSATDNLNINAGSIKFNGSLQLSNVNVTKGFFSTINATNLNTTNLIASTVQFQSVSTVNQSITNLYAINTTTSSINIQTGLSSFINASFSNNFVLGSYTNPPNVNVNLLNSQLQTFSSNPIINYSGSGPDIITLDRSNRVFLNNTLQDVASIGWFLTTLRATTGVTLNISTVAGTLNNYSINQKISNLVATSASPIAVFTSATGFIGNVANASVTLIWNGSDFTTTTFAAFTGINFINTTTLSQSISTFTLATTSNIEFNSGAASNVPSISFGGRTVEVFRQRLDGFVTNAGNYGKGDANATIVSPFGQTFPVSEYNCIVTQGAVNIYQQYSLALGEQAWTTLADGNGNWKLQFNLTTPTIPAAYNPNFYAIAGVTMIPYDLGHFSGFQQPTNLGEGFGPGPLFAEIQLSTVTASTLSMFVNENISITAGVAVPAFFGTGNIFLGGTGSSELVGDSAVVGGLVDVNIAALTGSLFLSGGASIDVAANTINFSTSVMNFDATTTLSNTGDFDLYAVGRIRLYAPWINIEDTTGNIINFQSNVFDAFTNIGRQRIKFGDSGIFKIMDITNFDGNISLDASNNNIILTGTNFTLTDPVSGGTGNLTVDAGNSLYWNGTFIA